MNVELFSYSVLASILGILIVFTSLCLLSFLMVLLKVVFKERSKETPDSEKTDSGKVASPAGGSMVSAVLRQDNNWIMAAVSTFLASEDENSPTASSWLPDNSEKSNPWMNRAAFDKKLG